MILSLLYSVPWTARWALRVLIWIERDYAATPCREEPFCIKMSIKELSHSTSLAISRHLFFLLILLFIHSFFFFFIITVKIFWLAVLPLCWNLLIFTPRMIYQTISTIWSWKIASDTTLIWFTVVRACAKDLSNLPYSLYI